MAKTARELGPEELRSYRPWQALERYAADPELVRRWDRAWDIVRKAATLLKEQFGATRIVVFGSLARKSWFTPWSDVDLAAWGIPVEKFYRAVGAVHDIGAEAGFKIDLIDPTECTQALARSIRMEGIEL